MKRLCWYWLPPLCYAAGIFFLSSRAVPPSIAPPEGFDKLAHFILYGGLGGLLARALLSAGLGRANAVWWTTLLGTLYGVSDEIHQSFVPERSSEVLDAVADAGGSLIGGLGWLLVAALWHKWRQPRQGTNPQQ